MFPSNTSDSIIAPIKSVRKIKRSPAERLKKRGFQTHTATAPEAGETKLLVRREKLLVKVEVNFVMRGTVQAIRKTALSSRARRELQADLELPLVSNEDLYGGKLVAALDRQHPRDLFDVMDLFDHEGITPAIRRTFVAYLAAHNRPIHEVLFPTLRDISSDYERTFKGMTTEPVELSSLLSARDRMISELHSDLDAGERQFLISLARNEPNWNLLGIAHLSQLPGIRWKLSNLEHLAKSNPKKLQEHAQQLERLLAKTA